MPTSSRGESVLIAALLAVAGSCDDNSANDVDEVLARESIVDVEPELHIGGAAPELRVDGWFKGKPPTLGEGSVVVIEFWATWCKPCLDAMPHLSELAEHYSDQGVVVVAVNVEKKPPEEIAEFVAERDDMRYSVGFIRGGDTEKAWIESAGLRGLPASFVVGRNGKLAWVGHPSRLPVVVAEVANDRWDPDSARAVAANERLAAPFSQRVVEYLAEDPERGNALARALISSVLRDQPEYLNGLAYHIFAAPNVAERDLDLAYEIGAMGSALLGWQNADAIRTLAKIRAAQSYLVAATALERRAAAASRRALN